VKIVCCWMYAIGRYGFPPALPDMMQAIRDMAGLGFRYIELEGVGYSNLAQVVACRERLSAVCQEAGVQVANFAPLLPDIIAQDEEQAGCAFGLFEKGVETAAYLGAPSVWVDSYLPPIELIDSKPLTTELTYGRQQQVRIPAGFSWPAFWEHFVRAIQRANRICKKHGVQLLIEPRVGEVTPNSDALLRLIEAVNDDNLGVILDTAHQYAQKEMLPLAIEKLGKHLRYVHIADNDGRENRHLEPGAGTIDWDGVFLTLKRQGFDGFYAVDLEQLPQLDEKFLHTKRFLEGYAQSLGL